MVGRAPLAALEASPPMSGTVSRALPDRAAVRGQEHAKRVRAIAAAGMHSLLML